MGYLDYRRGLSWLRNSARFEAKSARLRVPSVYLHTSPCIISTTEDAVYWQPQPFTGEQNVNAVERAFDIVIQPTIHTFYTTQFAGDMHAQFGDIKLTLLQTWSEDDFRRVQ